MSSAQTISTILGLSAGLCLLAAGCTPQMGYHPESDVPENHARVHKPDYRGGEVERGELQPVDPQADCGIDAARAQFDYDSAKFDEQAKSTVAELADCFATGPLAGHEVEIVGHADPRGPDEYNDELGMSRAEAVAKLFVNNGVPEAKLEVESHGEDHAHDNPDKWPLDRRVDVQLSVLSR